MKKVNKRNYYLIPFFFAAVSFILIGCQSEIKSGDHWHERFSDVNVFNQYIAKKNGKINIRNKIGEAFKLDGLNAKEIMITNSQFKEIEALNLTIGLLRVKNSKLEYMDFSNSKIEKLSISKSTLNKFRCKNCRINEFTILDSGIRSSSITLLGNQTATIKGSDVFSSHFFDSESETFKIIDSKFDPERTSRFARLKTDFLFIKNSVLNNSFYKSRIKQVVLENVKGRTAEFVRLEGERFSISDSSLARLNIYSITKSFRSFSSKNSSFSTMLVLGGKNMDTISITDCPAVSDLFIAEAVSDTVLIENCHFNAFKVHNSRIKSAQFKDLHISIPISFKAGLWRDFHMKRVLLENVHVDGTLEMKNARIDTLEARNFKTGKHFKLIDNGLNFHFAPDSVSSYSVADSPGTP